MLKHASDLDPTTLTPEITTLLRFTEAEGNAVERYGVNDLVCAYSGLVAGIRDDLQEGRHAGVHRRVFWTQILTTGPEHYYENVFQVDGAIPEYLDTYSAVSWNAFNRLLETSRDWRNFSIMEKAITAIKDPDLAARYTHLLERRKYASPGTKESLDSHIRKDYRKAFDERRSQSPAIPIHTAAHGLAVITGLEPRRHMKRNIIAPLEKIKALPMLPQQILDIETSHRTS